MVLQRYLTNKILPDFQRLTHYMKSPFIERTSNKVENYYRQTDRNQIKEIYKTITGILGYLNQKMKNGHQNTEKISTPNNLILKTIINKKYKKEYYVI
ncbi:hypothetical protein J2743_000802 [Methanobacterium petrolearium]|nr:hypothetical protein [Methanobacterium petrolearium]BDZ71666.1 hypothetical protein GCM10025861_21830 [Methanobacterium petrolearium]